MAIDDTALMREVDAIIERGQGLSHYGIKCRMRVGTQWVDPLKVELMSVDKDYENGYGDIRVIQLMVGLGQYAYRISPNRDNLLVDVTLTPLYENTARQRGDTPARTTRYRAILMEQDNPALAGRSPQSGSEKDLDIMGVRSIQLQLLDEGLYQARMYTVGGLYRKCSPAAVLRAMLTDTTQLTDTSNKQQIFGVDLTEGYNNAPRDMITIPHGTPLVGVADLLQNQEGGIYSTGLGCYLQDGFWRIFPCYDPTRYAKTPKTLTILNIPPNRYAGAERTYRVTANQVVLVAAGGLNTNDPGLYTQLNDGNAVRFTDARKLMSYGEASLGKVAVSRSNNVFEVEGVGLRSGLVNAKWSAQRATDNPYREYSEIARRNGIYMSVEWGHGDSKLLYPGMPVKYLSNANGRLLTLYGTLLGLQEQRLPKEGGAVTSQYPATVLLKVFLSRSTLQ